MRLKNRKQRNKITAIKRSRQSSSFEAKVSHEVSERVQLMLDFAPLSVTIYDLETRMLLDCNIEAVNTFAFSSKEEFISNFNSRFIEFFPKYQPDGTLTQKIVDNVFEQVSLKDRHRLEIVQKTNDGREIFTDVSFISTIYRGRPVLVAHTRDLTYEKEAETKLKNQAKSLIMENRIKAMLDASPIICAIYDENLRIIDVNQAVVPFFGLEDKQVYIDRLFDLFPDFQPDGTPSAIKAQKLLTTAFEEGRAIFEWMHCTLDKKTLIPCEVHLKRINLGEKTVILGYVLDKREQYKMRQMQDIEQQTLQATLDSSPLVCMLFDRDFNCLSVNRKVIELFGVPDKETFMNDVLAFSPEFQPDGRSSRQVNDTILAKAFESGYERQEWMCWSYTGELIPCEEILERVKIGDEYFVLSYLRDLREQHKIKELQESEQQRIQVTLDSSPLVCALFDRNHNALSVNQKAVSLFEIPDKQIYLDDMTVFMPEYQPDGSKSIEKSLEFLRRGFETGYLRYEWMYQTLAGKPLPCEEIIERITFADTDYLLVYTRDLTEQKEMLARLEESANRELLANQAKTRFLARMSHEIRTPMNSILGITELQLQKDTHPQDTEEAFVRIYNSSNLLLTIINDILDLSKVEAGKMEIVPMPYETASMIIDTVQLNLMYIGSKRIEFKLLVDENLPSFLIGDELRVKQILNNIISNAFKYTIEGAVILSFEAEAGKADDEVSVVIKVEDTGQGMTKEQIDGLFADEFTRFNLESNRNIEGSGLGLSIAYQLIKMMGGDIEVESSPGFGSVFTVRLPQKAAGKNVIGAEATSSMQNLEDTQKSLRRLSKFEHEPMPYGRVLVVDDVESNLYVAKGFLIPYKIAVETVESGILAIEKVKNGEVYDIIFMDHMMPDMDGVETTKILREMGYDQPIVALTANAFSDMADMFMANGFSGYASKPIDINQMDKYLIKFIRDKQNPEAIERARKAKSNYSKKDSDLSEMLVLSFLKDAKKAMGILEAFNSISDAKDLNAYIVQAHAMKSALNNIKQTDLSAMAAKLEHAGRREDIQTITELSPKFLKLLSDLVNELENSSETENSYEDSEEDMVFLKSKMEIIYEACENFDIDEAKSALLLLAKRNYSKQTKALIEDLSDFLLSGDFDEAVLAARQIADN